MVSQSKYLMGLIGTPHFIKEGEFEFSDFLKKGGVQTFPIKRAGLVKLEGLR